MRPKDRRFYLAMGSGSVLLLIGNRTDHPEIILAWALVVLSWQVIAEKRG